MEQPECFLVVAGAGAGDGGRAIVRLRGPDALKAHEVVEAINANPQFFQSPWRGCMLRVERPTTLADVVRRDSDVQECDRWATSFNIIARHRKPEWDAVRTLRRAIGAALQRCANATLPIPAPTPNAGMTLRDVGARVRELASVHPWVREGIERSVEDMLVLWDRRRDAEVAREQGTWDGDLPPDPFSLNPVDAPSLPEPERLVVLLYWLGGLADAGVEFPLARKPQKTGDTARDVLIHATYEKRTHEPPRPEQAEAWLWLIERHARDREGVFEQPNSSAKKQDAAGDMQTPATAIATDTIDEHDAAILAFLSRTPNLRRRVADVLPDEGPQDRKAVANRLRNLADRTPPLVDYPRDRRSGVAILPAGLEALKRATAPTPR